MGCVKSKPRSLPSDNEVGDHDSCQTKKTKTCCWTGIRKLLSKNKRVKEGDIDNDDDDDDEIDFTLVNDSSKSSAATAIEPRALHRSWSAPALLGQECEEASMPALSGKMEDQLPSGSYPKDVSVSFLSYNTDSECSIDQKEEEEEEEEEEQEQEQQEQDDQIEEMTIMTSQDDSRVDGIEVMFVISLIWNFILNAFFGVYQDRQQFVYDIVKEEDEDEMDVDEEGSVIVLGETGDCSLPGNPGRYSNFTSKFWAYIRNAFHVGYRAGLQFVQDMMGEEDEEDGTDVDQGWTVLGTGETGDHTPSGGPKRYLDFASNFWASIHDSIKSGVSQFFCDIMKEVEGSLVGTGETPHQGHPESDVESSDVDTDDETDPDQPSTSYRRDKTANYDFVALRLLLDSDSDDDDW